MRRTALDAYIARKAEIDTMLARLRDAFGSAKPNSEYARLYAAAVARRQADQIYNLSLTRTATVILGQGARGVIGVPPPRQRTDEQTEAGRGIRTHQSVLLQGQR